MFTARKDTRFAVECPVAYVLESKKGHGVVFNLSRGGCAIEGDAMASDGETVSLQITVPDPSATVSVELGMVRWATRREFGVEFSVVLADSVARLETFLVEVAKKMEK